VGQKMIAHIIGNGPSWTDFDKSEGDVYGCNMGHEDLNMIAVFIHDGRVFRHIAKEKIKMPFPVVAEQKFRKLAPESLVSFFDFLTDDCKERCSGLDALHYLMRKGIYHTIHLWGFDSLTHNTVDSVTGMKIPNSRQATSMIDRWKCRFKELSAQAAADGIKVIVH
jgi:hypothetical protein